MATPGGREGAAGLIVGLAAVLFGGVVILGKEVSGRVPVPSTLTIRFGVAAALLAAVLLATRRSLRPAGGEAWRLVLLGAAGYAVEAGLFFLALGHGTASAVTLLFFTYPVWVTLLSMALGRGLPGWLVGGSLAAAVVGASLVAVAGGGVAISGPGIVFALLAAITFSGYLVGVDLAVRRTSPQTASLWVSASAAVALGAYSLASGRGRLPQGVDWAAVVGMGVLTAAAFILLLAGLRRLGAVRTAIIAALEPVSTSVMAVLILGEVLKPGVIAGGVLILGAAVAASAARSMPEPEVGVP